MTGKREPDILVIGGGLAGCEAAWQMAERGLKVRLFEMRPFVQTPAHSTALLAEVVCSNSFGGEGDTGAAGILKAELELGRSIILECAHISRVPAGGALAVDRDRFAELVSAHVESHRNIELVRDEVTDMPDMPAIIATGPLTSPAIAKSLGELIGENYLSFFDAVAPIVTRESVDMERAYVSGRYGRDGDYINCPMNREEYLDFYETLTTAERVIPHGFEKESKYFEGCMPVEVMASRGTDTLRFGPMKPVGLPDPKTGREPYAVVQLRQDNREGTLYNLVGFQTGLKWGEQTRLIKKIPGLENAEIVRFGVMHRNIYVNAPTVLDPYLRVSQGSKTLACDGPQAKRAAAGTVPSGGWGMGQSPMLFLAGQITGVEGYMESTAMGMAAGVNAARLLRGESPPEWPRESAIGSLLNYLRNAVTADKKTFQPMNANLGIFPPLEQRIKDKKQKARAFYARAVSASKSFWENFNF